MIDQLPNDIFEGQILQYLYETDLVAVAKANKALYLRMEPIRILQKLKIPTGCQWPQLRICFDKDHFMYSNDPSIPQLLTKLDEIRWKFERIILNGYSFQFLHKFLPQGKVYLEIGAIDDYGKLAEALLSNKATHIQFPDDRISEFQFHQLISNLPKLTKLKSVEFGYGSLNGKNSISLMEILPHTSIEVLNVENIAIDCSSFCNVCKGLEFSKVKTLQLYKNYLPEEALICLAKTLPKTVIQDLDLDSCSFTPKSASAFAAALVDSQVKRLVLPDMGDNIIEIFKVFPQLKLENYNCYEELSNEAEQLLISNIAKSNLVSAGFRISIPLLKPFLEAISHSKIETLSLRTEDGDAACEIIAENIRYLKVKSLGIERSQITDIGAKALFPALQNSQLKELNLRANPIGKDGFQVAAKYLPKTHIVNLRLGGCHIDDESMIYIAECLKETQITHLEMQSLYSTNLGIQAMLNNLGKLKFLEISRSFSRTPAPEIDQERLKKVILQNLHRKIRCFNFR
ncbi:hypothetical protein HDV04_004410 [Boothiomyces sp. JEL0838]|nr:hypothetical protein HDV04_004410 [Boothiomyces sp. JEL0838]